MMVTAQNSAEIQLKMLSGEGSMNTASTWPYMIRLI
eukprot:COSAG01_NODE_72954_length_251_cov_1.328947_1_plen_35_part_10